MYLCLPNDTLLTIVLATSLSEQSTVSFATSSLSDSDSNSNSTTSTTRSGSDSSSTGLGLVVFSTNSDGDVFTSTRSESSSLSSNPSSSVSSTETSPSSSQTAASSSHSSGRTTTNSHGSSIVVYQTVSASSNGDGSIQQITYYSTQIITPNVAGASAVETGSSSTSSPTTANGGGGGSDNSPPASTVAGGVVGGVAGLAFIVLLAMLLLRWYRRKGTHEALKGVGSASAIGSVDDDQPRGPSGPGMAERAGLMPIMSAVPGMFRHQNRSTEASTSEPSERGFTRVSGRKLPSAFSEGMTGPTQHLPIPIPYSEMGNASTANFGESDPFVDHPGPYSDARYGAVGAAGMVPVSTHEGEQLQMSPGPARKPTVHHGGPYNVTPSSSTMAASPSHSLAPGSDGFGSPPNSTTAFLRSETPASLVDSRGSRFMEEV
ncbi:hypothetical protein K431DRAFT_65946 [Polychaeton citri CBS 116435]|uniref:Uncharacterized protein n=1 Tax=Polychaeton citri CBS 116435 TaxID=1314669 RepID=A0A9P4Q8R5_9PEZI|nr:hypothetical protein K431DRAFT_65946 [Polychaeton citri CBS 116435]